MPASRKAEDVAIVRAIVEWRGHKTDAANALHIRRESLDKRLKRLGFTPAIIEALKAWDGSGRPPLPTDVQYEPLRVPSSAASPFNNGERQRPPKFVNGDVTTIQEETAVVTSTSIMHTEFAIPIRTVTKRLLVPRLSPENVKWLVEFQREVEYLFNCETDLTALLNSQFEQMREEWAQRLREFGQSQIEAARKKPKPEPEKK